jgi:hypothetical protein
MMWDHRFQRLVDSGLWEEIVYTHAWARTITFRTEYELFLNPADAEGLNGYTVLNMPIRQSIGVERGKCLIFDRKRDKYIWRDKQIAD